MVRNQKDKTKAAIASSKASKVYDLKILEKDVQDDKENWTRFLVVTNAKNVKHEIGQEQYKTSVVFSGKSEEVGFLFKCLGCFSLRNINLTKIESRPIPKNPWKYYFYIDIDGHQDLENVKNALNNLKEYTEYLKILGTYKIAKHK
jgi:prephenate dehydratase